MLRTYIIYISVISTLFCLVQFYRENAVAYMHFNRTAGRAKLRPIYFVMPVFFQAFGRVYRFAFYLHLISVDVCGHAPALRNFLRRGRFPVFVPRSIRELKCRAQAPAPADVTVFNQHYAVAFNIHLLSTLRKRFIPIFQNGIVRIVKIERAVVKIRSGHIMPGIFKIKAATHQRMRYFIANAFPQLIGRFLMLIDSVVPGAQFAVRLCIWGRSIAIRLCYIICFCCRLLRAAAPCGKQSQA